jgi:hypothetical protein
MAKKMKDCACCGEEVLAVAIKCKHCGSELERQKSAKSAKKTSKITWFFLFLIVAIVIGTVLNESDSPNVPQSSNLASLPNIAVSPEQQSFVQLIESFYTPYRDAGSNELQKSQQRALRKEALQASLRSLDFKDWIGTILNVGTTGDGNAHITIELQNSSVELKTMNNELSDSLNDVKTLIPIGSVAFNSLINLEKGDLVKVSGRFVRDIGNSDVIFVVALTERGAMIDPSLLVRFDSIERY